MLSQDGTSYLFVKVKMRALKIP